jgi:hypothetical protein
LPRDDDNNCDDLQQQRRYDNDDDVNDDDDDDDDDGDDDDDDCKTASIIRIHVGNQRGVKANSPPAAKALESPGCSDREAPLRSTTASHLDGEISTGRILMEFTPQRPSSLQPIQAASSRHGYQAEAQ